MFLDMIFLFSGMLLHEMALRNGYSSRWRIFLCAIGFYFGPISIPLIFIIRRD